MPTCSAAPSLSPDKPRICLFLNIATLLGCSLGIFTQPPFIRSPGLKWVPGNQFIEEVLSVRYFFIGAASCSFDNISTAAASASRIDVSSSLIYSSSRSTRHKKPLFSSGIRGSYE